MVTCDDWDLKTMYPNQCRLRGMKPTYMFKTWINIKKEFEKLYSVKAGGLSSMLKYHKMKFKGRQHSGINDCINTAYIWIKMLQDGNTL